MYYYYCHSTLLIEPFDADARKCLFIVKLVQIVQGLQVPSETLIPHVVVLFLELA
jgi:hypothetical protein